jgi:hypothetical protein
MSSTQSVSGQPVAAPAWTPAHQGRIFASLRIWALRSSSSCQVSGIFHWWEMNSFGEYHTSDFTFAPSGGA